MLAEPDAHNNAIGEGGRKDYQQVWGMEEGDASGSFFLRIRYMSEACLTAPQYMVIQVSTSYLPSTD